MRERKDHGKHYNFVYRAIRMDPYRIIRVYQITDPAHQHAVKKLLRAGRSVKPLRQDIEEVIQTLERMLEMMDEDAEHGCN